MKNKTLGEIFLKKKNLKQYFSTKHKKMPFGAIATTYTINKTSKMFKLLFM